MTIAAPLPLLGLAAALLALGALWHPLAPACVAGSGALLTVAAARGDRFLVRVSLIAFGVRAGLAAVLHGLAWVDLPVLRAAQNVQEPGGYRFWSVTQDAVWYHVYALQTILMWKEGTEFPSGTVPDYFVPIALGYVLWGPNPLNAVLWNALFGSLTVVLAHRLATRMAGPAAARVSAILVGFWPSAILWSTQLLKDALTLWLMFSVLSLTIRIVDPPPPEAPRRGFLIGRMGQLGLLFAAAFALYRLRSYLALVLIFASGAFVLHALVWRSRDTPWRLVAACAVVGVAALAISASRHVDLERLLAPAHPEISRVRLGAMCHQQGRLDEAEAHYHRALRSVRQYPPALERLAILAVARGDRGQAIAYFQRYLAREPHDESAHAALVAVRSRPEGVSLAGIAMPDVAFVPPPADRSPAGAVKTRRAQASGAPLGLLGTLTAQRTNFIRSGGRSAVDTEVGFSSYADVLRYVPRALANVFLAPYPWQWFDVGGATGRLKPLSAAEAVLLYVLIVPLIVGLVGLLRGSPEAWYLAVFVTTIAVLLGLVVNNIGTLFRLRLESLLPLFAAGGLGWARLLSRCRR